ncbi:protein MIZU-KUSSEI 1 [Cucurbita pepo subsp. pepo]|uniref:protein MIZU-KUSSEI 1 n=1 Tax=Cucurbita pepo subsp. pepo TaxID=3664 RepID=UPI000C9DA70D|nr:protein MIZU-KUSSEI 1 [Cucurbita pepo subsp. pepo]
MPSLHSSPFMDKSVFLSLLRHTSKRPKSSSSGGGGGGGGLLKMFKLFPMLSSGCKMVALLGRPRKPLLKDHATTGTIFGYRKGRVSLAIQEDPHCLPIFIIELPMHTAALNKEMASDILRIALESETKTHKKKLMEEFVWAVYCNGRKIGYSIRRKQISDDELHVMQHLRGVSMGAGVLPSPASEKDNLDGELTYMRARFERVVGSKDSEALYMINPDGAPGPELSIFFVRSQ